MTKGEFTHILNTEIRPYVSELASNAAFAQNKIQYIKEAWGKLFSFLSKYNFDDDTFKDLHVRYRNQIETDIRKKYVC
jgi:hypothetical protein